MELERFCGSKTPFVTKAIYSLSHFLPHLVNITRNMKQKCGAKGPSTRQVASTPTAKSKDGSSPFASVSSVLPTPIKKVISFLSDDDDDDLGGGPGSAKVWGPCPKKDCNPECSTCKPSGSGRYVVVQAEKHGEPPAKHQSSKGDHFYEVTGRYYVENSIAVSAEMLEASFKDTKTRLSSMAQQIGSEWAMFLTASIWLRHDPWRRIHHAAELFGAIKFSNMPSKDYLRCRKFLQLWELDNVPELGEVVKKGPGRKDKGMSEHAGERRHDTQGVERVVGDLAIVVDAGTVLMGKPKEKMVWTSVGVAPCRVERSAAATLRGQVYVCGGWSGESEKRVNDNLRRFDPFKKTWTDLKPMRHPRAQHCAVALYAKIYVFGGVDDDGRLMSSTECYDPKLNEWSVEEEMPVPLCAMAACAHNGQAWLLGGLAQDVDSARNETTVSDDVLVYNPLLRNCSRWFHCEPLRVPRAFCGVASVAGNLYLAGGVWRMTDGTLKSMSDIDVMTVTEEGAAWRHCMDMQQARSSFAMVNLGECLVFVGGVGWDDGLLASAEMFSVASGKWTLSAEALPRPAAGLAAVVT